MYVPVFLERKKHVCDSDNIIGKGWANLSGRYAAGVGLQRGDMGL